MGFRPFCSPQAVFMPETKTCAQAVILSFTIRPTIMKNLQEVVQIRSSTSFTLVLFHNFKFVPLYTDSKDCM